MGKNTRKNTGKNKDFKIRAKIKIRKKYGENAGKVKTGKYE